jgi:hypothetical protein
MVLTDYTYVFAIGTMFALLEAFNNGASMSRDPLLSRGRLSGRRCHVA